MLDRRAIYFNKVKKIKLVDLNAIEKKCEV
jgi:hypothetical protein